MPRKRKKGIEMPPLEFVHSPLYQDAPVIHYDFGNSNTARARTVCVDELENFSWVSPQFRRRPTTHVYRARKPTKSFTRLRSKSEGSPLSVFPEIKSKFPPLQFVHSLPSSPEGRLEENKVALKPQEYNSSYQSLLVESEDTCDGNHDQRSLCIEDFRIFQEDFLNVKTPDVMGRDTEGCVFQSCQCSASDRGNELQKDIAFHSPVSLNGTETENCSALLQKQFHNCGRHKNKFPLPRQCIARNILLSQYLEGDDAVHPSPPGGSETSNDVTNRWNLGTPPRSSHHVKILVNDTPECDYGLSMRQRQLKYMSRSQSN